ncbi:MAG: carboxypeptidase-like regulatory domain-containing protein [Novosphingobium sp.]
MSRPLLARIVAVFVSLAFLPGGASAQLYGNYAPRSDHTKNPVNVWFGAVRNGSGRYLANATIVLETRQVDFVAVTNAQGRYRLELPVAIKPAEVRARCSLRGYRTATFTRRLPRAGASTPVQLDCTLR